jgi:hypothetical protein
MRQILTLQQDQSIAFEQMAHEHHRRQVQQIEYHPTKGNISHTNLIYRESSHTTVILAASSAVSMGFLTRSIKSLQIVSNSTLVTFNLKSRPS